MNDKDFLAACRELDSHAKNLRLYGGQQAAQLTTHLPFYATVDPLELSPENVKKLQELGPVLAKYFQKTAEMRGDDPHYIFLRPDILLTEKGLKICEVETSVFGFSLALFLEKYIAPDKSLGNTARALEIFCQRWQEYTGRGKGTFVYTDHSKLFAGQLTYLAEECQKNGADMRAVHVRNIDASLKNRPSYRCFYWHEREKDAAVTQFCKESPRIVPSGSDIYEGKQMLVLWRNGFLRDALTTQEKQVLDDFFLPTWLVTPHVPSDFPIKMKQWDELAALPKSKRLFVMKRVGNHPDASWARSVVFLHKRSHQEVLHMLHRALLEPGEWVIQSFIGNEKYTIRHADRSLQEVQHMKGRIRITPYYDFQTGELLLAKATIRSDTLFIHGASDSVNTILSEKK